MKVCIVSRNINNDYTGSFEFDQAMALKKAGCDVYVISLDFRSVRRKRKLGMYTDTYKGISVLRCSFPIGPVNDKLFNKIGCSLFKKAYLKLKETAGEFDFVHSHFLPVSYITVYTLKNILQDKTPVVVTEHSSTMNVDIERMPENEAKKAGYVYTNADRVISVSKALAQKIKNNFGIDCEVIYNVFDSDIFRFSGKTGGSESSFVFVSAGNLTENKRMDLLIRGFYAAFKETFGSKKTQLCIFGDGPEREALKDLIEKLDLTEHVFLMGQKSRKEIADFYTKADAFVLLSQRETFGVAYIEAMAAGLPVISCHSGGPEDFIQPEVGIFSGENETDAAEALLDMRENRDRYDSRHISEYAESICGSKAVAAQIKAVYEKQTEGKYYG